LIFFSQRRESNTWCQQKQRFLASMSDLDILIKRLLMRKQLETYQN
jgi:hypothetical protein